MKQETGLVRISFNTHRSYSQHGQRIAAQKIGGDVIMVDVDRMIEYYIKDCPLEQGAIMAKYDGNKHCQGIPANLQYREIVASLEKFAVTAPSVEAEPITLTVPSSALTQGFHTTAKVIKTAAMFHVSVTFSSSPAATICGLIEDVNGFLSASSHTSQYAVAQNSTLPAR